MKQHPLPRRDSGQSCRVHGRLHTENLPGYFVAAAASQIVAVGVM